MKQSQPRPAIKDAVVLDLGDLGRQAAKLREQAEAKAARIIADAERQARELTEGAEQQGLEQGKATGLEQGLEEGREQGRVEAFEQASQQLTQLQQGWTQAIEQWTSERSRIAHEAESAVLQFALKFAERVIHRSIEIDEQTIVRQLAEALEHVLRPVTVQARVHPDDAAVLGEAMPDLAAQFSQLPAIELIEDETMTRGGCEVTYGKAKIDATIETQIARLTGAALGRDV